MNEEQTKGLALGMIVFVAVATALTLVFTRLFAPASVPVTEPGIIFKAPRTDYPAHDGAREFDWQNDYLVELINDGALIRVYGHFDFGVADAVAELVESNSSVRGVLLDSPGGYVVEGRAIAEIIQQHELLTYVSEGCYSACTTAFVAGRWRSMVEGAEIGFHRSRTTTVQLPMDALIGLTLVEGAQGAHLVNNGVSPAFAKRAFETPPDDMLVPDVDELFDAGVIDELITLGDLVATDARYDRDKALAQSNSLMRMLAQIQLDIAYFDDADVVAISQAIVSLLPGLADAHPLQCLRLVDPDRWGIPDIDDLVAPDAIRALQLAVTEAYRRQDSINRTDVLFDKPTAINHVETILVTMDPNYRWRSAALLEKLQFQNNCRGTIELHSRLLELDTNTAANALRFLYDVATTFE
ncbi:MAG: hypothetical protein AAGA84_00815 [Pseudomonadota bacterium]